MIVNGRSVMDLAWTPTIHSSSLIDIPIVTAYYNPVSRRRYLAANEPWIESERKAYFRFKEYAELARGGRVVLPFRHEAAARRFNEVHAAWLMQGHGFSCWAGVHLFYEGALRPKGFKTGVDSTSEVQSILPWLWPREIQRELDFRSRGPNFKLRNPDLVAYSNNRNEWRFCEVKGPTEPIGDGQPEALAVLHLLTAAPVAILRVVPDGLPMRPRTYQAKLKFKSGAELARIHKRIRKKL